MKDGGSAAFCFLSADSSNLIRALCYVDEVTTVQSCVMDKPSLVAMAVSSINLTASCLLNETATLING